MSIDTSCSADMVVVRQGCQSIRTEESDISVVDAASTPRVAIDTLLTEAKDSSKLLEFLR